jgi:hypothetical protein
VKQAKADVVASSASILESEVYDDDNMNGGFHFPSSGRGVVALFKKMERYLNHSATGRAAQARQRAA